MKIMLAQINTTPRDFNGNLERIEKALDEAARASGRPDLIVFPEMAIPGYLVADCMYDNRFIRDNLYVLNRIAERTSVSPLQDTTIVVGYVDHNHTGQGKPFRNMAAVIRKGYVIATYAKQLLPFYDVFDEGRYFEPGTDTCVVEIDGLKWGICICEDVWNDKGEDDMYGVNPLQQYRNLGVRNIISINSSPYWKNKPAARLDALDESSNGFDRFIYVNQVGGQDEIVFDGHSVALGNYGPKLVFGLCDSEEQNLIVDIPKDQLEWTHVDDELGGYRRFMRFQFEEPTDKEVGVSHFNPYYDMLVMGLRDYIVKCGFKSVVVGSSGGIDSAVTIALCAAAIGAENVHAVRMPSVHSSQHSQDSALLLHRNIGCWDYLLPIEHIKHIQDFNQSFEAKTWCGVDPEPELESDYNPVADENIQARIRGMALMHFSNSRGALLISTGNKTELAVGYCTIYGDMCGGFNALGDILKMDVYRLANYINNIEQGELIPQSIIDRAPSAELSPDQKDSDSLPPYPILDLVVDAYICHYISDYKSFLKWIDDSNVARPPAISLEDYDRIIRLIDRNEFKRRQAAPCIKVSKVAFGTGRRVPIVKGNR